MEFGAVLADAGYGISAEFRRVLSDRGLFWAVGNPRIQKVYPLTVELRKAPLPRSGRPPKHPVPTAERISADELLGALRFRCRAKVANSC